LTWLRIDEVRGRVATHFLRKGIESFRKGEGDRKTGKEKTSHDVETLVGGGEKKRRKSWENV